MQIENEIVSALSGFLVWSVSLTDRSKCIMQTREVIKGGQGPPPNIWNTKNKCVFNKCTFKVCICCFWQWPDGPPRLAHHTWLCHFSSVVPDSTHTLTFRVLQGSSKSESGSGRWGVIDGFIVYLAPQYLKTCYLPDANYLPTAQKSFWTMW